MQLKVEGIDGKIKAVAAGLGMVQAVTWIILSFICIILYFESTPRSIIEAKNYREFANVMFNAIFFQDKPPSDTETFDITDYYKTRTMTSKVFTGFMWIYFFLDVAWLVVSVYILLTDKPKIYKVWGYLTLAICVWDFITFVILGADYDKCLPKSDDSKGLSLILTVLSPVASTSRERVCDNIIVPALFIAAKGFTLWIVNILFGIIVLKMGTPTLEEDKPTTTGEEGKPTTTGN